MIEKVSVNNWMAHEKFVFELKAGKNLIFGNNAAGKTSLAKAIAFGLTGYIQKNNDPRRDSKSVAFVDIIIQDSQKESYLIRRQLDKGVKIKPASLFVYKKDNLSIPLYQNEEAEAFLEKIIGISDDIFHRVVYMKEEDVFEFLAKPANNVKAEIDRLVGLDKANTLYTSLEKVQFKLEGQQKFLSDSIKDTNAAIKVDSGVKAPLKDIKVMEKRSTEINQILGDLKQLKKLYDERMSIQDQLNQIKYLIEEESEKKLESKLVERIRAVEKERDDFSKEKVSHEKESKELLANQNKLTGKKELKEKLLEDMQIEKGKIKECPICGREMDNQLIEKTVKKLQKELEDIKQNYKTLESELEKKNQISDNDEKKIKQIQSKINDLKTKKITLGEILQKNSLNESMISNIKKKGYPDTLEAINDEINKLGLENESLNREIGKAEGAKEHSEKVLFDKRKDEETIKHKLKLVTLIDKAIKETMNKLRVEYEDPIKTQTEEIWQRYKGVPWEIDWDANFVPKAKKVGSERFIQAQEMSGSEKFLLMLAIRLAIQQSLQHFQLLIIDEPCQHLDEKNGKIFRDIITSVEESKIKQSIIFTYNQNYLEGKWSNIVKLS